MLITFVAYGAVMLQVLIDRSDYNLLEMRYENDLLDGTFTFGSKDGFMVAAGLTNYPIAEDSGQIPADVGEL